jgi:hypothetical protein
VIILSRDKSSHSSEPTYRDQKPSQTAAPEVRLLEAAGEAGMALNAADWDGRLNVDGRFSRNSRMNLKNQPQPTRRGLQLSLQNSLGSGGR